MRRADCWLLPRPSFPTASLKAWWRLYYKPLRLQFLRQDTRILEPQNYRKPEKLSASDLPIIEFRRLAPKMERQPRH